MRGTTTFRRMAVRAVTATAIFLVLAAVARAQSASEASPEISEKPLSADQLDIYRAILDKWLGGGKSVVNLSDETRLLQPSDEEGCGKGLDLEVESPVEIHRFRPEDLGRLGPPKRIALVDPQQQKRAIADNDPSKKIREGATVEDAVRNGYSHGLFTFSEIRFNRNHDRAVVAFGFVCGGLCGHGATVLMEKAGSNWEIRSQCAMWMSRLSRHFSPIFLLHLRIASEIAYCAGKVNPRVARF